MGKKYVNRIESYEEGGIIPETGIYKLHEGEEVVSKRNRLRQQARKKFPGDKKAQNSYAMTMKTKAKYHIGESKQSEVSGDSQKTSYYKVSEHGTTSGGRGKIGRKSRNADYSKSTFKQGGCDMNNSNLRCE